MESNKDKETIEENIDESIKGSEKADKKPVKKIEKLERIHLEKLRGRVIIFNPEESEFAKNLHITKAGDYIQKAK